MSATFAVGKSASFFPLTSPHLGNLVNLVNLGGDSKHSSLAGFKSLPGARELRALNTSGSTDLKNLKGLNATAAAKQLGEVASDFETMFLSELLKQMRGTLEPGGLFGSSGGDVYGGLFDMLMGKHLTESGGIGLAQSVQEFINNSNQSSKAQQPKLGQLGQQGIGIIA